MQERWSDLQKIAFFVSVGVAGGAAVGFAEATDLSPALTGLLAGLLAALLGSATFALVLRLLGKKPPAS